MGQFYVSTAIAVNRAFNNAYNEVAAMTATFASTPEMAALMLLHELATKAAADSVLYMTLPDGSVEEVHLKLLVPEIPTVGDEAFAISLFADGEPMPALYRAARMVADTMEVATDKAILAAIAAIAHARDFRGVLTPTLND